MARFRFKLQPVLDQRQRDERDKQMEVARIERERLALESRIRLCQQMMSDERSTLTRALSAGHRVDLRAVRMQAGATLTHNFEAQRTVLELAGVLRELGAARAELAQAAARRMAVELLRDQQLEAFKRTQDIKESHDLDEMSVMRFNRNDGVQP